MLVGYEIGYSQLILGNPRATSRDDMQLIFLGESLLQELKSPWELILTEPVPEVVEFRSMKKTSSCKKATELPR